MERGTKIMNKFIKPCEGRYTSHFRTSDRPNHNGIDIAKPGEVHIVAAADGKISRSYSSKSYGEVIFIAHYINGQTYETVYAHMRSGSRLFKQGDKVEQGQIIGLMGNTGHSYGQHLHFEIHKGRWNINKSNAVDPFPLIKEVAIEEQSEISAWAKDAHEWVKENNISDGKRPKDTVTREEVWTMLYNNR